MGGYILLAVFITIFGFATLYLLNRLNHDN